MTKISRRQVIGASSILPFLLSSEAKASQVASGPSFTQATVIPQAAVLSDIKYHRASTISALTPYRGKILAGYGDYGVNSGSMTGKGTDLTAFDPRTGKVTTVFPNYPTESIQTIRVFGPRAYATNIDPSDQAGSSNSFIRSNGGNWSTSIGGVDAQHIYDVCEGLNPSHLLLATGTDAGATIFESIDYGKTWAILESVIDDSVDDRDGFERCYWLSKIGSSVYWRPNLGTSRTEPANMRRYDLRTRKITQLANSTTGNGFIKGPYEFSSNSGVVGDTQVLSAGEVLGDGRYTYFNDSTLRMFNGVTTSPISNIGQVLAIGPSDFGLVCALTSDSVYILNGSQAYRYHIGSIPEIVVGLPSEFRGFCVANGRAYVGGINGIIYSSPMVYSRGR